MTENAFDVLLADATIAGTDDPQSIGIRGDTIAYIGPRPDLGAEMVIECAGRAVIPGLIESHIHLDKALLDSYGMNESGTLAEAMSLTAGLKENFTFEEMYSRAERVARKMVANGTTWARVHCDVDPVAGLLGVEVLVRLREAFRGILDLQIVAFPQDGILTAPSTLELLGAALDLGADVVGACPYSEATVSASIEHLRLMFALAHARGLPLDIHADFGDDVSDPRFALARTIAALTATWSMQGSVVVSHMTSLASLERPELDEVLDSLLSAGVALIVLPATDLHLGGRGDTVNVRRGIAPVEAMMRHGMVVSYSSNNVRNAFTPYGNADLLETGLILAQTSHLSTPAQLTELVHMGTTVPARILGIAREHGLFVGATADLVVLDASSAVEALLDRAVRRYVIKAGRIVAETVTRSWVFDGADFVAVGALSGAEFDSSER